MGGLTNDPTADTASRLSALSDSELDELELVVRSAAACAALPQREDERHEIDRGRLYELSAILGLSDTEADKRWEKEWEAARSLVASGQTIEQAWRTIRREFVSGSRDYDRPVSAERVRLHRRRRWEDDDDV